MGWAEPKGKRWRGRYLDETGRKQSAPGTYRLKTEAENAAADQEALIRSGTWHDPQAGTITFAEYYETIWRPNKQGEVSTLSTYDYTYRSSLKPEFGDMQLRKIRRSHVVGWVTRQREAGVHPSTITRRFRSFQTILAGRKGVSAMLDGYLGKNPCAAVELPTVPTRPVSVYEKQDVKLIMEQLDPWWRVLVALAAETGMRWGELMGVTVGDFTVGYRKVVVRRTVVRATKKHHGARYIRKDYTKGKKPRPLGISPAVRKMVIRHVAALKLTREDRLFSMPDFIQGAAHDEQGLFIKGTRKEIPPGTLPKRTEEWPEGLPVEAGYFRTHVWLPAIGRAGVEPLRFHDLRASHISWLIHGGLDVAQVQERAGHEQLTTTQKYVKALETDDDALAAMADMWDDNDDDGAAGLVAL